MLADPQNVALFVSVLIACVVEAVEATTIVLAAGTSRHWRSAGQGVIAGLVVLAVVVAVAGPAIQLLPLNVLRLVVGGLLLIFGLQWLRKAINRASGYRPLHDEAAIYQKQLLAARAAANTSKLFVTDWYAFTLSFKGVVLEGLEVVFIVLTFGTNQHNVPLAAIAASVAVVIVVILGFVVRGPLARVPENTMKFIVGVLLSAFGIFWGAEGAGAHWPGADTALLILAPAVAVFCLLLTAGMRVYRHAHRTFPPPRTADRTESTPPGPVGDHAPTASPETTPSGTSPAGVAVQAVPHPPIAALPTERSGPARRVRAAGMFLYDFVIGDDWRVAAAVAAGLALTAALATTWAAAFAIMPLAAAAILPYSIRRALR